MNTSLILLNAARVIVSGWGVHAAAQEIAEELSGTHETGTRSANPKFHHKNEREERLKHSVKLILRRVSERSLTPAERKVMQAREHDLRWHVRSELTRRLAALKAEQRRGNPYGTPVNVNQKPATIDVIVRAILARMRDRRMNKQQRAAFEARHVELTKYIANHAKIKAHIKHVEQRTKKMPTKSDSPKSRSKGEEPAPAPVAPAPVAPAPVAPDARARVDAFTKQVTIPAAIKWMLLEEMERINRGEDIGFYFSDEQKSGAIWYAGLSQYDGNKNALIFVTPAMRDLMLKKSSSHLSILERIRNNLVNSNDWVIRRRRHIEELDQVQQALEEMTWPQRTLVTPTPDAPTTDAPAPVAPAPVAPAPVRTMPTPTASIA